MGSLLVTEFQHLKNNLRYAENNHYFFDTVIINDFVRMRLAVARNSA